MPGYEWANSGIMQLSSALFADETSPEQLDHSRLPLLAPYGNSCLELAASMLTPLPPLPVTATGAPAEEDGYSLSQYCGLLLPPMTADLQARPASSMGLNVGVRTCFSAGELIQLDGDNVRCWWSSGDVEPAPGEGGSGVLGAGPVSGSCEDVLYEYASRTRCQADGCVADMAKAKLYHRRHKVCEYHSKAAAVVADGRTQRFCQQCSRFHVLSEFDRGKRSCRRRLAEHNRRRRKYYQPPPPTESNSTTSGAAAASPQRLTFSGTELSGAGGEYPTAAAASLTCIMTTGRCSEYQEGVDPAGAHSSSSAASSTSCLSSPRSSSSSVLPHAYVPHFSWAYEPWISTSMWEADGSPDKYLY
ncbi:hypothetical protein Taro_053356 [Colocasia esculenta]|uniref:SBP-type domain-containing protein n=1 Tax=Colocasia esculenta TaxID=4460 RepID=A0A843XKR3_COLES|nr:hypothetical protein [Colocasia esculenta]